MKTVFLVTSALVLLQSTTATADWMQFRCDASRSGYTAEPLAAELKPRWFHRPVCGPQPAWAGPDTRMPFDYAYHAVLVEGLVVFGSSADGKVYALDADTGSERWTFFTDGPVRFAPAAWKDRLYVAGDDGCLYCLETQTGALLWKKQGGPMDDLLLGNGRMISRWPVRGAPVVLNDLVYFSAGIWPSEGIFIYAVRPDTGEVVWLNDKAGDREMDQPHPTAFAKSGVSSQGYLSVTADTLLVPTGRSVPAAFNPSDGSFLYFHLQEYRAGTSDPFVCVADGRMFAGREVYDVKDGRLLVQGLPAATMAVFPEHIVYAAGKEIRGIRRESLLVSSERADRKGNPITVTELGEAAWTIPFGDADIVSLIGAGQTIIAGTAGNEVLTADIGSHQLVARVEVDGLPLGLASANGRLVVSTDKGSLFCFDAHGADSRPEIESASQALVAENAAYEEAAEEVIAKTGVTEGYCLDMECGNGRLAYELARRTNLYICAIDSNRDNVCEARRRLDAAGLYGNRAVVLERDPAHTHLPNLFANLIVSGRSVVETANLPQPELERLQRPYGGVICIGKPGGMRPAVRGPLEGAGEWTHLYHNAANTNCSDDSIVRGPLGMLWFVDNDWFMPSRHGRGPSPLFWNGLLFIEGLNGLRCLDAYNGHVVWQYPIENVLQPYDQEHLNGAAITGSNFCVAGGSLFVRLDNRCVRLDAASGQKVSEFEAPLGPDGAAGRWGYLACENGTLYGSLYNTEHTVIHAYGKSDMSQLFSESALFFAMDAASGQVRWTFTPNQSIRNNTIAIGANRAYLIDRAIAIRDRSKDDATKHPPGELIALDTATGQEAWRVTEDVYGTMLALSVQHDVLLMMYQDTRFKLASELGGRMTAYRASDGMKLWDIAAHYESRPILNDRTIYAQPGAWDLLTGEKKDFDFSRSYGCGTLAGSKHLLTFRSATVGYRDLTVARGTENYGGIRPGCWINTLPVGGLVLMPEATNRCTCSYLIKATVALQPYGIRPPFIEPKGAASPKPIEVMLGTEDADTEIRYTLDGTSPTLEAFRYDGPIHVEQTTTITARAFREGVAPSQTVEAAFVIDPSIILIESTAWSTYDSPGANVPASNWQVANGVVTELSNLFKGEAESPDPAMERPGTLRIFKGEQPMKDGTLTLELASSDDDVLGVAFRYRDPAHFYLWSMDRQRGFHALACKDGDTYRVLATAPAGYEQKTWYRFRLTLEGSKMSVYLNDLKDIEADDAAFSGGTFALYAWGCAGAQFRNIRWQE